MLANKQCSGVALRNKQCTAVAHSSHGRRSVTVRSMLRDKLPVDASTYVGDKVGAWLGTTFDLLAFPGRAGAGALVSMPERLQTLQTDMQRLVELAQDPRPLEEKQDVLRKELEATVVEFLEKGIVVEQDVISNLKTVLPPDAANALSDLIPEPPNKQSPYTVPVDPQDIGNYSGLYTAGSYTEGSYTAAGMPDAPPPTVTYGQQDVLTVQIASEITEIRNAVSQLKAALDGMRTNTDVAAAAMLRLTLRDARDQLQRRLSEVSVVTAPEPSVAASTLEARILLDEVNAMFFS